MFLYTFFATFEFYYEQRSYITIATLLGAVINVLLNVIFINVFGYISAAYTTLFCFILFAAFHYCFMHKITKENLNITKIYDSKIIVAISILFLISGMLIMILYKFIIVRYLIAILCLILCFVFRNKIILQINNILRVKGD